MNNLVYNTLKKKSKTHQTARLRPVLVGGHRQVVTGSQQLLQIFRLDQLVLIVQIAKHLDVALQNNRIVQDSEKLFTLLPKGRYPQVVRLGPAAVAQVLEQLHAQIRKFRKNVALKF